MKTNDQNLAACTLLGRAEPIPPILEELGAMIGALSSEEVITGFMRERLRDAIEFLYLLQLGETIRKGRGRPKSIRTEWDAMIIWGLKREYRTTVKAAVLAVAPGSDQANIDRLSRAYRSLRKSAKEAGRETIPIHPSLLEMLGPLLQKS